MRLADQDFDAEGDEQRRYDPANGAGPQDEGGEPRDNRKELDPWPASVALVAVNKIARLVDMPTGVLIFGSFFGCHELTVHGGA